MNKTAVRLHRQRKTNALRDLLAETRLHKSDFVMPLFINEALSEKLPVTAMPGVYQLSLNDVLEEVGSLVKSGINSFILFGIPSTKDEAGSEAYNPEGIIQKSITLIKDEFPDTVIIADCCLCEYTAHGHCGVMESDTLNNDATLEILQKVAVSYAQAGADIIAPSGMMDGMVAAIRTGLDANGFQMTSIMSYAVKYASAFYGPFREAGGSDFKGDRAHHQLAPTQKKEALREARQDEDENADFLMVKPAMPYLDILSTLHQNSILPLAIYHTSGEYAMIKAAAAQSYLNEEDAFLESFIAMKRAGATIIITYYCKEIAKII